MGKNPAFQFYPGDWSRDLEEHPLEIEGAWIRICCKLWWSDTRGSLTRSPEQWARILRETVENTERILNYIKDEKVGDVTLCNGQVTVVSRRMLRDEKNKESTRIRVERHRQKTASNAHVTPKKQHSSSSSSSSTTKKRDKSLFVDGQPPIDLAKYLFSKIQENNPKAKSPNWQVWAKQVDLMLRRDNRSVEDIRAVIDWCQDDEFWSVNILSTQKLREKFDQLYIKMGAAGGKRGNGKRDGNVFLEFMARKAGDKQGPGD